MVFREGVTDKIKGTASEARHSLVVERRNGSPVSRKGNCKNRDHLSK